MSNVDNRRRFFRIVDSLGVAYRVVSEKEIAESTNSAAKDEVSSESSQGAGEQEASRFIDTYSLMNTYNQAIKDALGDLETAHPEAAIAIDHLNKKVDTILMMLELDSLMMQTAPHRVEQASISASGIAFPVDEQLAPNTCLALDLLLKPSIQHVTAIGKVIACDSLPSGSTDSDDLPYYLRVEFTEMSHKDRESLIQHIVQRQGALLRALKNEMDD